MKYVIEENKKKTYFYLRSDVMLGRRGVDEA